MTSPSPSAGPRLRSGHTLPVFGLGVYKTPPKETAAAVTSALELGYRHVDTAQIYGNEQVVGDAVGAFRASHPEATPVFITTKLWRGTGEKGYDRALAAIKESARKLGGVIDLLLMHCPGDAESRAASWRAMEDAQTAGLVVDLGVSNFSAAHLVKLGETARVAPSVNQLEVRGSTKGEWPA